MQSIQIDNTGKASSIIAAALAAVLPGLGHIYRRRFVLGAVYLASCAALVAVLLFVPFETRFYEEDEVRAHVVIVAVLAGLWAWQIVDAARFRSNTIMLRYACGHSDRIARTTIETWLSEGSIPSVDLRKGFLEIAVACDQCSSATHWREAST